VDVMDGRFVEAKAFTVEAVAALREKGIEVAAAVTACVAEPLG
jgi:pentose-5-phosphate-3-epimerase